MPPGILKEFEKWGPLKLKASEAAIETEKDLDFKCELQNDDTELYFGLVIAGTDTQNGRAIKIGPSYILEGIYEEGAESGFHRIIENEGLIQQGLKNDGALTGPMKILHENGDFYSGNMDEGKKNNEGF